MDDKTDESSQPCSMLPPQIEDLTRSGASSPALSSGKSCDYYYTHNIIISLYLL